MQKSPIEYAQVASKQSPRVDVLDELESA
jgi:hypothetical protein